MIPKWPSDGARDPEVLTSSDTTPLRLSTEATLCTADPDSPAWNPKSGKKEGQELAAELKELPCVNQRAQVPAARVRKDWNDWNLISDVMKRHIISRQ